MCVCAPADPFPAGSVELALEQCRIDGIGKNEDYSHIACVYFDRRAHILLERMNEEMVPTVDGRAY